MFDTFPNASGQIAVNSYISVLSRLGLWSQQDNLIRLTPEGTALVNKAESAPAEARRMVIEIKYRDFLGYDALFKLLAGGPQSLDDIHEHLKEALAVDWKSKNQTSFRVNWLRSLGYVEKEGKEYRLTGDGTGHLPEASMARPGPPRRPPRRRQRKSAELRYRRLPSGRSRSPTGWTKLAMAGGDGKEFEEATEAAFKFLGFETQLISGSGNPTCWRPPRWARNLPRPDRLEKPGLWRPCSRMT